MLDRPAEKYVDLFWLKVEKGPDDACWLWKGRPMPGAFGYGRVQVAPCKTALAHRVSYAIAYGPISPDDCVLHRCDTPACVRPDHLFKGDRGDNARDMASKGRQWLQRNPRALAGDRHWKRRRPELIKAKPPRPCINCARPTTTIRRGRCTPCSAYFRRHGIERPTFLYLNPRRQTR